MYNYKDFLNESSEEMMNKMMNQICDIITTKTDYELGDDKFIRGDNRTENYITGLPRKRRSSTDSNISMDWVDQAPRWEEFPSRGNSLTFLKNEVAFFGANIYRVLPFKGVPIAYSSNGDFNYAFINDYLEEVFEKLYDVGLNDNYGKGYSPGDVLGQLFFEGELEFNHDLKIACGEIEEHLMNTKRINVEKNPLLIYKPIFEFQEEINHIKKSYFKWLGKHYKDYYGFVDFLMDPKLNGFEIITYKEAVKLGNSAANEFWIDEESIMIFDSPTSETSNLTLSTKVINNLINQQLNSKGSKS